MPTLSYGLNLTKKPGSGGAPSRPSGPVKKKPVFGGDSDSEDESSKAQNVNNTEEIGGGILGDDDFNTSSKPSSGGISKPKPKMDFKAAPAKPAAKPKPKSAITPFGDLSTAHSTRKHAESAVELDPSIYDYDGVYDQLHSATEAKKEAQKADAEQRKPKYMGNLLAAAEVRKRDQLRAKEKMLAKEREEEGDEFADKEKFVTGAYKAQQEEMRKLEEEERLREEEESKRRSGGQGMMGFYKDMLARDDKRHEEILTAAEEARANAKDAGTAGQKDNPGEEEEENKKDKNEAEVASELKARGVVVNEEGQVVDKRQLLSAGLNVKPKPKPAAAPVSGPASRVPGGPPGGGYAGGRGGVGVGGGQRAMRERQSRMLEAQLEQASKRAADDEDDRQQELERAAKSRKTEGDISSAKERYLQRKREAAAAAAAAGKP